MLIRAVKSVSSQTYPNIELVIVDDGSNYDVETTLRKEGNFTGWRVIKNTRTPGAAGARNSGFDGSHGEYIGFLDDDDEWLPDKITKQIRAFQASDNALGAVITSFFVIHKGEKTLTTPNLSGHVFKTLCREHVAGNTSNALIRRTVLNKIGLFDERMSAAQDTDLLLRIAKRYEYATVSEPLVLVHWQTSDRITNDRRVQIRGTFRFLCKHWGDLHPARKYNLTKRIIRLTVANTKQRIFLREVGTP